MWTFANMLLTVAGKGRKERKIPFSDGLRQVLWRYFKTNHPKGLLFGRSLAGT
jgi:site-specific recombinase XerD